MSKSTAAHSIATDYLHSLGRAMFAFANLEWQAVWCCELISPGFLADVRGMTAGQMAKNFQRLAAALPSSAEATAMAGFALKFGELVGTRNDIAHANPGTQEGTRAQLLFRHGAALEVGDLAAATDEFESCARELNRLFYDYLRVSIRPPSGASQTDAASGSPT